MKIYKGKLIKIDKENSPIGIILNLVFEKNGENYTISGTPQTIERDFSPSIYNWIGQEIIQTYKRKLSI